MTITIHSTSKIVSLIVNGVPVASRLWEGQTESGTPVHCFITRISPTIDPSDTRNVEFVRELQECAAPTVPGIPLRLVL